MLGVVLDTNSKGSVRVVTNYEKPVLAPNDFTHVLVKIVAAGITPGAHKIADIPIASSIFQNKITGMEFAGTVEAVNDSSNSSTGNSSKFKKGDRVYGVCMGGAYAEYYLAETAKLAHFPDNISFTEAACLPINVETTIQALRHGKMAPGKRVLVIGASGGCGNLGIQLAKANGASHVVGICSAKNAEYVKSLGADEIVDYNNKEALEALNKLPEEQKFDIIYDTVTCFEDPMDYAELLWNSRKKEGYFIAISTNKVANFLWQGLNWQKQYFHLFMCDQNASDLEICSKFLSEGKISQKVTKTYDMRKEDEVQEAMLLMKTRRVVGKIAYVISEPTPSEKV